MKIRLLFNFFLRSSLLILLQRKYAALLILTTKSQHFLVGAGESIQIPCEFRSEQYTAFTNPIIWKKLQNSEETPINIMGNILDPFLATNRFTLSLVANIQNYYKLSLRIIDLSPEDSGNYSCEIRGPKSVILGKVVHTLSIISPVSRIFWEFENSTDELLIRSDHDLHSPTDDDDDDGDSIVFFVEEGVPRTIRCVVVGGYPLPETRVFVGEREVTDSFPLTYSVSLDGGDRGLRLMTFSAERTADDFAFSVRDDQTTATCLANVPGVETARSKATVNVLHRPLIICHTTTAFIGERNVSLRCEVRARPHLVALFWIVDGNGTTLTDGGSYNDYWSMVLDRVDGVMETRLFVKRVLPESFKRYTIIAENVIAVSMSEAQLVKGGRSAKNVFQTHPSGSQARNDDGEGGMSAEESDAVYSSGSSSCSEDLRRRRRRRWTVYFLTASIVSLSRLTQMTTDDGLT